jgi:5-methylcytosine-specific restriction endonuclease McrA
MPEPRPRGRERWDGWEWQKFRLRILERDGWRCMIPKDDGTGLCGADLKDPGIVATVDHIISRVHAPDLVLDPTNVRAACQPCNNRRGGRTRRNRLPETPVTTQRPDGTPVVCAFHDPVTSSCPHSRAW